MYYIKIENDVPVGYPLTEQGIRSLHPTVSLPLELTFEILKELGYAPFQRTIPPIPEKGQVVAETTPFYDGTVAMQTYELKSMTDQEKSTADSKAETESRIIQRSLLTDSDWTELPSVQAKHTQEWISAWADYRTAVRDVDKDPEWPYIVNWPKLPTVLN